MLLTISSFAQPTLTANGVNPQLGETIYGYLGSYVSPGGSGANQNWDFTALAGASGELYSAVLPSATAYASTFPNSNLVLTNAGQTSMRYFGLTSTSMDLQGAYTGVTLFPNSDPEIILRYPFTMGSTSTDNWAGTYTTSALTYRSGITTVTADAYGTMVTPAGTFTNCLRVHMIEDYQDSLNFGSPFVITYYNDQYIWFQEGFHYFVASTFTLTSSSGLNSSGASYFSAGPVGIDPTQLDGATVQLYPNPATDQVTLALDLPTQKSVEVHIYNSSGQVVQTLAPKALDRGLNELALAINELPNGIYFCKISQSGHEVSTKRLVVNR